MKAHTQKNHLGTICCTISAPWLASVKTIPTPHRAFLREIALVPSVPLQHPNWLMAHMESLGKMSHHSSCTGSSCQNYCPFDVPEGSHFFFCGEICECCILGMRHLMADDQAGVAVRAVSWDQGPVRCHVVCTRDDEIQDDISASLNQRSEYITCSDLCLMIFLGLLAKFSFPDTSGTPRCGGRIEISGSIPR
jgi:hypothetical protein